LEEALDLSFDRLLMMMMMMMMIYIYIYIHTNMKTLVQIDHYKTFRLCK